MSLKAKIRNTAKQKNIPAQAILQNIEDSSEFKAMWDKYRKCILRRPTATDAALTAIRRSQRQCAYSAPPNGRWCGASGR